MKSFPETYDLIVAGAGFAGFSAAIQSSRLGMKTLLIEKNSQWGGVAYEGMHQSLCGLYLSGEGSASQILNSGLSKEIADMLISRGQARAAKTGKVTVLEYEPQAMQQVFNALAKKETNLDILFEACVEDVQVQSQKIQGIRVRYQNEVREIQCRALVDCSGSGEMIRLSGASYEIAPIEERQLAAYAFEIEGVAAGVETLNLKAAYYLAQAVEQGRLFSPLQFSAWMPGAKKGHGILRISVFPSDSGYPMELIKEQARQVLEVLKNTIPEFLNSRIVHFSSQVVEREGLRMCGRYTLTREDVLTGRKFEDGIVKSAWPIEFWDPQKGPRYDYLEDGQYYEIPLRCLQSKDIVNLFSAGRCISAEAQALASTRVTGTCLVLGEQAAQAVWTSQREESAAHANIVKIIAEETKNHRNQTAFREGAKSISYGDLLLKTEQIAGILKTFPLKKYARAGLLVRESIDYVILNLAVLSLQAVIVPIPQTSSSEEIELIVRDMKLDLLIFERPFYPAKEEIQFMSTFDQRPFQVVFFESAAMEEQHEFELLNPAFIRFTSGTTGQSKGVVISHEAIQSRTEAADQALKMTSQDIVIWVLSMSYHFIVTILLFLRRTVTIVLCEHEIPKGLIEGLDSGDATFIYAAPVHYQAMIQSPDITRAQCSHIRMAVSTTTHLSAQTAGEFSQKFGFELNTTYGVIEIGLPFVNHSKLPDKRLSVGRLVPGYECRLAQMDKDGVGIVQMKGPGMFAAYFSPWKIKDQIAQDGWFETGDIGRFDGQGFLFLLGRHQQVINFLGMKIFPREVEDVLQQNPVIEQAYVYGEEHTVYGQMPCAKIMLKAGYPDFNEDALRKFCYAKLPSYKVPKKFECVQFLRKTKSGKVKIDQ